MELLLCHYFVFYSIVLFILLTSALLCSGFMYIYSGSIGSLLKASICWLLNINEMQEQIISGSLQCDICGTLNFITIYYRVYIINQHQDGCDI
jgi:hypothetical protein